MKIELNKKSEYRCEYVVSRKDNSTEVITLDIKTYFLHDITHFVVEKELGFHKGFWGMLSKGYSFDELFGKDNPKTEELRFVEQIVGPVQSVVSGHIPLSDFEKSIDHLNYNFPETNLHIILSEISSIIDSWKRLEIGQKLILNWDL